MSIICQMEALKFRKIEIDDFAEIRALHDDLFPVKYSDSFYFDSCRETGLNGVHLFTNLAIHDSKIVGFIFAQFIPLQNCEDNCIIGNSTTVERLW